MGHCLKSLPGDLHQHLIITWNLKSLFKLQDSEVCLKYIQKNRDIIMSAYVLLEIWKSFRFSLEILFYRMNLCGWSVSWSSLVWWTCCNRTWEEKHYSSYAFLLRIIFLMISSFYSWSVLVILLFKTEFPQRCHRRAIFGSPKNLISS